MSYLRITEEEIDELKVKLKEALGEGYEVETHKEVSALYGFVKETFDLVIFYHDDAICGIEYMEKIREPVFYMRFQDLLIRKLKNVGLKYGIAFFDIEKLYFWTKGSSMFETFSFDDMVIAIKGNQTCGKRFSPIEIKTKFEEFIPPKLNEDLRTGLIERLQDIITEDNLEYDEESASIGLKSEAEDEFFRLLLQRKGSNDAYQHVCRYTSLNSLFLTMEKRNHVMCSITCMNDKGETSYADKYVGYGAFASSTNSIQENNDCFILSCCDKRMEDNLTMWRLYGNDAKGVCLEYEVDLSKIDNKDFFFSPVSYGVGMNEHPTLDYIRDIRHWRENGWCFQLKRWYIWKHFFKSYLFKEENEVRLLYVWTEKNSKKNSNPESIEWIMDASNSIASRKCKFPIDSDRFPLTLTKAIIGPKCPEQESNVDQFNYMNRQTKIMPDKSAIKASKIEDYR